MSLKRPVVLIIRDGWGENHNPAHDAFNAVKIAQTPVSQKLTSQWPRTEVLACGLDVGLPEGIMGNSEVGHQNIGAGRIVDQEIVRITKSIDSGEIEKNPVLNQAFDNVNKNGSALHFVGLISDAGVHSDLSHLFGLLEFAKRAGLSKVFIHALTDGRDTPPKSGLRYVEQIEAFCEKLGIGKIATVCGRYWAMDRDHRWDRVEKAYNALTGKSENKANSTKEAVQHYYSNPIDQSRQGDEFVIPTSIIDVEGNRVGPIKSNDSVIVFNFRGDRPREITRAFIDQDFSDFDRGNKLDLFYATLTDYKSELCHHVIFPRPSKMNDILGQVVSDHEIPQFRCAETEKYPHVTFFFNDYREEPFPLEDWELIPSPKDVPTYDLKPQMSADGICRAVKKALVSKKYGLVVVNFANADMVGHTGLVPLVVKAVETVDRCVGEILEELDKVGGVAVITADHGNADQLWMPDKESPHTQHTLNPVEVIMYGVAYKGFKLREEGRLADLAPTVLQLMGIDQPEAMTGVSLIQQG